MNWLALSLNHKKTRWRVAWTAVLFAAVTLAATATPTADNTIQTDTGNLDSASMEHPGLWQQIKGRRARNALLTGMWSLHLDGSGEFFGSGRNNDRIHLIGIQHSGYALGTFINSHSQRTYFAGLAREIHSIQHTANTTIDFNYNIGLMYGYGDNLVNIFGISGLIRPTVGITWKRIGVDFGFVPLTVATLNFRIEI